VTSHVFVDETKEKGYVLVAAAVIPTDLVAARRQIRRMTLGNQGRIHFYKERDSRRRQIIDGILELGVQVTIYDAGTSYRREIDARAACLSAIVTDCAASGAHLLVLEQDDSLLRWDNQLLIELTRTAGCRDNLRYEHKRAATENLLVIPDAVAWCWARGGDWRKPVEPLVTTRRTV
jgi:hypothetical protein